MLLCNESSRPVDLRASKLICGGENHIGEGAQIFEDISKEKIINRMQILIE